jgi:hypothetical protein
LRWRFTESRECDPAPSGVVSLDADLMRTGLEMVFLSDARVRSPSHPVHLRVPVTVGFHRRQLTQCSCGQSDVDGTEVVLQVIAPLGPGDRYDVVALGQSHARATGPA